MNRFLRCAALAAVLASLFACGGGAADPAAGGNATVTGVQTPSSVSVVTAKNAQ